MSSYPECAFIQIDDFDFSLTQNRSSVVPERTEGRWLIDHFQDSHFLATARLNVKSNQCDERDGKNIE